MSTSEKQFETLSESDRRILRAVKEVQFGSVEVTVHNGRVVQVERREKIRLNEENREKPRDH